MARAFAGLSKLGGVPHRAGFARGVFDLVWLILLYLLSAFQFHDFFRSLDRWAEFPFPISDGWRTRQKGERVYRRGAEGVWLGGSPRKKWLVLEQGKEYTIWALLFGVRKCGCRTLRF